MTDTERLAKALSRENLIKCLNGDDDELVDAAETFLGVCKYPEDYWIMPDYYYPGIRFKRKREGIYKDVSEFQFLLANSTSGDSMFHEYFFFQDPKNVFFSNTARDGVNKVEFKDDENIVIYHTDGNKVEIPWGLFCVIFNKAREIGYSRPDVLDKAGPSSKKLKEKWLKNQEKIKELQSKLDD